MLEVRISDKLVTQDATNMEFNCLAIRLRKAILRFNYPMAKLRSPPEAALSLPYTTAERILVKTR